MEHEYKPHSVVLVDIFKCLRVTVYFHQCHIPRTAQLISLGYFSSAPTVPSYAFSTSLLELMKVMQLTGAMSSHHIGQTFHLFHKTVSYSSPGSYISRNILKRHIHLTLSQYSYVTNELDNFKSISIPLPKHNTCPSCVDHPTCISFDATTNLHCQAGSSETVQVYTDGIATSQQECDSMVADISTSPNDKVIYFCLIYSFLLLDRDA